MLSLLLKGARREESPQLVKLRVSPLLLVSPLLVRLRVRLSRSLRSDKILYKILASDKIKNNNNLSVSHTLYLFFS